MTLDHFGVTKVTMSDLHKKICLVVQAQLKKYNIKSIYSAGRLNGCFAIDIKINDTILSACHDDIKLVDNAKIVTYSIEQESYSVSPRLFLDIDQEHHDEIRLRLNEQRSNLGDI